MNNFKRDSISNSTQVETGNHFYSNPNQIQNCIEFSLSPQIETITTKELKTKEENMEIDGEDLEEKFELYLSNAIKNEEIIALENQLYDLMLEDNDKTQKGLPVKYFKRIKKMKVGFATKQCSVCVSNFVHGDVIRKLPCGHIYHEECLKPWLRRHTNCPLCRMNLLDYFNNLN